MCEGRWNRHLGWIMLVVGFATAVWLDPWSLGERDPSVLVGSARMAARHAQAVTVGMALLQLMVAKLLAGGYFPTRARLMCSVLSGCGAIVYAAGYVLLVRWPAGAWLIMGGALLNYLAFVALALAKVTRPVPWVLRAMLLVFCGGMVLDALMGWFNANPAQFLVEYIGPEHGLPQRLLRLARAAVIALPLLTLFYPDLAAGGIERPRLVYLGQLALAVGAVGMPLVLILAAFTLVELKYLLPIPAQATFAGTLLAAWLASRLTRRLELWGWLLIALSMAAGLFMGLYAFDGPFPAPDFLGAYNDYGRRLSRLGHAYCIVPGLVSIFLARELAERPSSGWPRQVGVCLVAFGSVLTVTAVLLLEGVALPMVVLSVGPALVTAGLICCLVTQTVISR